MNERSRKLGFVQFPHPRDEHYPGEDGCIGWNQNHHARKFVLSPGRYVAENYRIGEWQEREGDLAFWGEWEPQSVVAKKLEQPNGDRWYPRYLWTPVLGAPPTEGFYHNTDPCVFGDRFRYTNCRQYSGNKRSQLHDLTPSSVILFGSHADGRFILDTVLIIGEVLGAWTPHKIPTLRTHSDEMHYAASIEPVQRWELAEGKNRTYTLYGGVTFAERENHLGMFSFVPALQYIGQDHGFPRPGITLQGIVNPASKRTARLNFDVISGDLEKVADLWREIVRQVQEQGCVLAHSIAIPRQQSEAAVAFNERCIPTRSNIC